MKAAARFIGRLLKYGTLFSTYGLLASVLVQIFARFFLDQAPAWTEEAARLFFIYSVSFAAGLALKNGYYVHLDLLYERLSPRGRKLLDTVIPLLVLFLFSAILFFSLPLVRMGFAETSPGMGINMSVAFFSMFLMAAGICFYAVPEVIKAIKKLQS